MGATLYDNELSENPESNSSCNSFLDGAFVDDAPPPVHQPPRSRSYYRNRFSSHALVTMLAVYLLLLGRLANAAETNQTTGVLTSPSEVSIPTTKQDIDNEISATLEENPANVEKENFLESPLTENLEDTIRSSVKTEIEMEQNVGSPALLNAYNVMPETENIVLVEYPGATTSAPKHELPVESNFETQCDESSLVCIRPNNKELPSSTAINIMENIEATTIVPEIEILSTTTVVPIAEDATPIPESDPPQIVEKVEREGRRLQSEITHHALQSLISESTQTKVLPSLQHENQTVSDIVETPLLKNEQNVEPPSAINASSAISHGRPIEAQGELGNENLKNEQNADSLNNAISTINHLNVANTEIPSEPVISVADSLLNETNEAQIFDSMNPSHHLNASSETNNNEQSPAVGQEAPRYPNESIAVAENNENLNEHSFPVASSPQNEIETSPVPTSDQAEFFIQTLEMTEAQNGPKEPIPQSSQSNNIPSETLDSHDVNIMGIIKSQGIQSDIENTPILAEAASTQNSIETNLETVSSNDLLEPESPKFELQKNLVQPVSFDGDSSNETVQSVEINNHNITFQEIIGTTPSNELKIAQHSVINLENETLSITFEEPLTATELPVQQRDDYIKTIIDMEDPLLNAAQIDQTTVQPEQSIHNVIKKQGVEPIAVEEPINIADLEPESTTLLPIENIPIVARETEAESVYLVHLPNENVIKARSESSTPLPHASTIDILSDPNLTTNLPVDITEVSVVFPGKGDADASLNSKGSRSINSLNSPLTDQHKASVNFDVYPAGQTFNENLAEELPDGIGKALPTHRLNEQSSNRSTLIIALCSGTAVVFIVISVTIFMVSFQRQHGTLDIEMQERRDNINDDEIETCVKLLDVELPNTSLALQTDAEAEIEECL